MGHKKDLENQIYELAKEYYASEFKNPKKDLRSICRKAYNDVNEEDDPIDPVKILIATKKDDVYHRIFDRFSVHFNNAWNETANSWVSFTGDAEDFITAVFDSFFINLEEDAVEAFIK